MVMTVQIGFIVFLLYLKELNAEVVTISLGSNDLQILDFPVDGSIVIHAANVTPAVAYIKCQAHMQASNLTLTAGSQVRYDSAVTGRDVGVVSVISETSNVTWNLYSNSTTAVRVLVHLEYFTKEDPLVGGCNQEFNLENDPNIQLHVQTTKTTVQFQWSNSGVNPETGTYPNCEDSSFQADLEYHTYVKYIEADDFSEDSYFGTIKQMLTGESLTIYGTWLNKFSGTSGHKSLVDVSSYRRRGVVYNTLVRFSRNGVTTQAAYIPVVSYGCDIGDVDSCKKQDVAALVLSTIGGFVGLFVCFFGHRFFKTENFLFGFLIFALLFYQIFTLTTDISYLGRLVLAAIFGLIGGTLLLGLWWYHGIPVVNVLFIGLVTGYLIASVLFYTPFGNLTYLQTAFNYGGSFACGVLIVPVILLFFTRFLSIFSCAVVGSFTFILMFDLYLHSAMYAIVLNSIRHGTDTSYVKLVVTGPFTDYEIALSVVWVLMLAMGTGFQLFRERKKAPFPPCPRQLQNRNNDLRRLLQSRTKDASPEREPLLRGGNQGRYGTNQRESPDTVETGSSEVEINRPGMI